jgi:peroxiredoxin
LQVCENYEVINKEHKITVVGISVDEETRAKKLKRKHDICFDLLCDTNRKVIEKYDVVDSEKRMGKSIALSADIIIDQHGDIIYYNKGSYKERPSVKEVLKEIGIE